MKVRVWVIYFWNMIHIIKLPSIILDVLIIFFINLTWCTRKEVCGETDSACEKAGRQVWKGGYLAAAIGHPWKAVRKQGRGGTSELSEAQEGHWIQGLHVLKTFLPQESKLLPTAGQATNPYILKRQLFAKAESSSPGRAPFPGWTTRLPASSHTNVKSACQLLWSLGLVLPSRAPLESAPLRTQGNRLSTQAGSSSGWPSPQPALQRTAALGGHTLCYLSQRPQLPVQDMERVQGEPYSGSPRVWDFGCSQVCPVGGESPFAFHVDSCPVYPWCCLWFPTAISSPGMINSFYHGTWVSQVMVPNNSKPSEQIGCDGRDRGGCEKEQEQSF